jgi:hypothetical protein
MPGRLTLPTLACLCALALMAPPAVADGMGSGWTDGIGVGAQAETETPASDLVPGAAATRSSGSKPRCTYELLGPADVDHAEHMAKNGLGPSRTDGPGTWYRKICFTDNGGSSGTILWVPQRTDPQTVARQTLKQMQYTALVDPVIGMSPPASRGAIVNMPLWLWVDSGKWAPTSATATVDGVTVQTTASPDRVTWSLGTGDEIVCDSPGTPYDQSRPEAEQHSDCTFVYPQAGTFTVTATVEWDVSWTAVGAAGGGNLGVVRRSASTEIPVSEIQALNRPPR